MGIEDLMDTAMLEQLKKTFQENGGDVTVTLKKIFTDSFMSENTSFSNIQDFLKSSGISVNSADDILSLLEQPKVNDFVKNNTKFSSLTDMFSKAQAQDLLKNFFQ